MKNNFKKVILSLSIALVILMSGNLTFASSFRRVNYYSPYKNNNLYSYISNYYSKYYKDYYKPNQETPSKPNDDKEQPVEPEKPVEKPTENTEPNITDQTKAVELEVVRLVNEERKKAGLAPLTHSDELSRVARFKSQDMADKNYFSHNSPTYGDPFTMMKNFGINYRTAGENIAKGYPNAQSVVKGWMNSPGHRANILNPKFGTIGVGYVVKNGTTYWTQMFTN
ncbi:MAG TPA: CAP domain-containing protein [Tissierellales bacterium]|nr:CAP domain-containing protein [Tissierellales bacterium]